MIHVIERRKNRLVLSEMKAEKESRFFFKRKKGNNRKNECNRQRTVTNMIDNTSTVTLN